MAWKKTLVQNFLVMFTATLLGNLKQKHTFSETKVESKILIMSVIITFLNTEAEKCTCTRLFVGTICTTETLNIMLLSRKVEFTIEFTL